MVRAQVLRADVGEIRQHLIQRQHLFWRGAFLRPEAVRGALRATQRVVDVGGDVDADAGQARVQATRVDAGQLAQRASAWRQAVALRVHEAHAQRRQHAGAGVVGG
ncbi:hypothetical protein G6F62_014224 [Rhizopus arrhizus]|nr:hypothetical protein G6F62_014224 [Rhizopus arrhizus]